MTDARERLADLLKHPNQMYRPASMRQADVDAILAALRLTPEAAAALMDGTAVVVPRESTIEMCNAAIDVDSFKLGDISPLGFRESPQQLFGRCYHAMLAASPYRSDSNAGV